MKNQKDLFDFSDNNQNTDKEKTKKSNKKASLNGLTPTEWVRNSKNVWNYKPEPRSSTKFQNQKVKIRLDHGATFSESLAQQLISIYSKEEDVIFDPFLGIGTTAVAAYRLNRKTVGIELNKDFYNTSLEYAYNSRELFDLNDTTEKFLSKFNIVNDDCRNMSKHIKKDQIQFTLTSPPYANFIQKSVNYRKNYKKSIIQNKNNSKIKQYSEDEKDLGNLNYDDYLVEIKNILKLNYKVTKPGGYAAWIVKDYRDTKNDMPYVPIHSDLSVIGQKVGWKFHDLIILDQNENRSLVALGYPTVFYTNQNCSFVVIFRKPN